jgi:hypothetical protein
VTFCRSSLLLAALLLAGCDDDSAPTSADFAAPSVDDMAAALDLSPFPDMAPWCVASDASFPPSLDAGGFCDGTTMAGTCAQEFFRKFAECFRPAGCCLYNGSVNVPGFAWESGARFQSEPGDREYYQNGAHCAHQGAPLPGVTGDRWTLGDGEVLDVDTTTGDVTCPDGSHANIGANYGGCAELNTLRGDTSIFGYDPAMCFKSYDGKDSRCCAPYPY